MPLAPYRQIIADAIARLPIGGSFLTKNPCVSTVGYGQARKQGFRVSIRRTPDGYTVTRKA